MAAQNNTESFIEHKLTREEDHEYLRKLARTKDASGLQKKLKEAQMKADGEKVAENREKETKKQEKELQRVATITETGKNLVLLDADINKLNREELNRQLDYHREAEKTLPKAVTPREKVPLKSHMKKMEDRVRELKKAVSRYLERGGGTFEVAEPDDVEMGGMAEGSDNEYESDFHDDLA
jgi:hypothetical protein